MATVGIRELRDHLSGYLRRVRDGEALVITDRGKPVGELRPVNLGGSVARAQMLASRGVARWSGGRPKGLADAPRPAGDLVSDAVLEDRR